MFSISVQGSKKADWLPSVHFMLDKEDSIRFDNNLSLY